MNHASHPRSSHQRNSSAHDDGRPRRCRRSSHRGGATLIDVAVGSMLLAVVLIPSISLIRDTESLDRRVQLRETMLFESQQLIEQSKIQLSEPTDFVAAYSGGRAIIRDTVLTPTDGPTLRGRVTWTPDASVPGGGRLLTIDAVVWHDLNGDMRIDPTEPAESLRTQRARP